METYIFDYADQFGQHQEAVEAYDQEDAVQQWRRCHAGQRVHLFSVCRADYQPAGAEYDACFA